MEPTTAARAANQKPDYDVVIVGFGPSGAVAACWLGQAGIRTLVIDKRRTIWEIPRAIAIDHEILRVFQNIGAVEKILPYTAPFPASEHFGAKGQLIRRIDAVPPPFPLGYVPTMVFTQPPVEAVLRARAAEHPSVTVELGLEAFALTQTAQQVTLQLKSDDGQVRAVTASYVIACDGASSPIRQLLDLKLEDLGFDEPWMVVDVRVNEASLSKLPQTAAQYCDPARPTTFIVGPGNHRRWEIMLLPDENPLELESETNVWRLLSPWLTPQDGELWRASSYRFHALVAEQWRKGRVFLAGDAAHQQPPFIGQGMCQGIRDVSNLAWKLETVLAGKPMIVSWTPMLRSAAAMCTLSRRASRPSATISANVTPKRRGEGTNRSWNRVAERRPPSRARRSCRLSKPDCCRTVRTRQMERSFLSRGSCPAGK